MINEPHVEDQGGDDSEPAHPTRVRWRPWPCESCRGGSTALGFLVRSPDANPEIPDGDRNEQIDWRKRWEAGRLIEWVESCPHTAWSDLVLPRLDEGSEHIVLFDGETSEVVKITRPGLYGDYYEIVDGLVVQFGSTPAEYLRRMRWWDKLFSAAPKPLGLTETGQVVSRQQFIRGDDPSQEAVDQFLTGAGLVAVKQSCWLWKKVDMGSQIEVWIGDARWDNFVSTADGIIPIDIRVWSVQVRAGPG